MAPTCTFLAPQTGGTGPDGFGVDSLIPTPSELGNALVEVVSQLKHVDTFAWQTETAPMPFGVFKALEELTTLRHMHVAYSEYNDSFYSRESPSHLVTSLICLLTEITRISASLEHHA